MQTNNYQLGKKGKEKAYPWITKQINGKPT
jgi:hypothetical protein